MQAPDIAIGNASLAIGHTKLALGSGRSAFRLPRGPVTTTATSELDTGFEKEAADTADAVPGLRTDLANAAAGCVTLQQVSSYVVTLRTGQALAWLQFGWLRHGQILLPIVPSPPAP